MTADTLLDMLEGIFPGTRDLWLRVSDYLGKSAWGVPLDSLLMATGVLLTFILLRRPQRYLLMLMMARLAGRSVRDLDPAVLKALKAPAEVLPVAFGAFLAVQILALEQAGVWARLADHIVITLVLFAIFWAFFELATPVVASLRPGRQTLTETMTDVFRRTLEGCVVILGAAVILEAWGIRIGPLLAGMGIFGAALALGAQDLVKNLIAGFLILVERRFRYGDWVKVSDVVEGTVEYIGFRSTRVRQFDDAAVEVPNAEFSENAVINYSRMRRRRINWVLGLPYSTSIDQLREIRDGIEKYIVSSGDFVSPQKASTFVRIDSFGESSINIMVYCFTNTTVWGEWLEVKERFAYAIMGVVTGAGSGFAFPSTSLYHETIPRDLPEMFMPPRAAEPGPEPTAAS